MIINDLKWAVRNQERPEIYVRHTSEERGKADLEP